ncbi:unnamed protein product [Caenorhabditis auriculariae]|uniref:DM domain-containing protein n=1 Tax=Caenorhabditis auriculariae TaxID=2777116 RepID=A0A8S1HW65_9PELO|nr:unnamed protein product [Caenorhabditis auriculariae]
MKTMGEMICEPQATTIPISLYQLIPSFAATTIREEPKKVYYCQRCLNHNRAEPRKNHKCDCPFAKCSCFKCSLVEKRRRLNLQLHELEGDVEKKDVNDDDEDRSRNKGGYQ